MGKRSVALAVVAVVGLAAAGAGFFATRVTSDDDVLAFLPRGDVAVRDFREVSARFGGLDVVLAGVETDDVFRPGFLDRVERATKRLAATPGVASVLSLTNVECFTPDPLGGVRVEYLCSDRGAGLRERVLGNADVVGQLVDREGRAILIYVFVARGADATSVVRAVRGVTGEIFAGERLVLGGAPAISSYLTEVTQRDVRRLAPFLAAALLLVTALALRSAGGTLLALATPGVAIVLVLGAMGALGIHSNLVLAALPILLLALGGALAVYVLAAPRLADAIAPVAAGGAAAAAGMLSFLAMDIAPLRIFGVVVAAGVTLATVLALTFLPALLRFFPVRPAPLPLGAPRGRIPLAIAALAAAPFALGLRARMDDAAFYDVSSPPAQAEELLRTRFGGATFVQVEVEADLTHPLVLRELTEIADRAALLPGVTRVTHVGEVVALTHEAMSGERALPDTVEKARLLYGFLEGKAAVRQLIDDERRHALIQVKLGTSRPEDAAPVVEALRALARERSGPRAIIDGEAARARVRAQVLARIAATLGHPVADLEPRLVAGPGPDTPETAAKVEAGLVAFLSSDEYMGELPDEPDAAKKIAAAAVKDGTTDQDLARPLADLWRRERAQAWARALVPTATPAQAQAVGAALLDLERTVALEIRKEPGSGSGTGSGSGPDPHPTISIRVTGQPVLQSALSRAVERNLVAGTGLALLLVFAVAAALRRSLVAGALAVGPTLATLAILGAAMRLLGLTLDLGTVMVPALILGAGAAASFQPRHAAPAVWAGALLAAAGFLVLAFGEARPLRVLGGLTAAGLVLVALVTLAFARSSK